MFKFFYRTINSTFIVYYFYFYFFINLERQNVSRISIILFKLVDNDKNTRVTTNILVEKTIYSYFIESTLKNSILFSKKFSQILSIIIILEKNI